MNNKKLTFGSTALDRLLEHALTPKNLVIIAGHHGTGKSLLALLIAYNNAVRGNKVFYVKIGRRLDREISTLKLKGFNVDEMIATNRIIIDYNKYVRNKMLATTIMQKILDISTRQNIDIFIIDTINPIYRVLSGDEASLMTYYNDLLTLIDDYSKYVILLVDLPRHKESEELEDLAPLADAVIILKKEEERGFVIHKLKITKGAYLPYSSIIYTIRPRRGLTIYPPILLGEIPPLTLSRKYSLPCRPMQEYIGKIYGGEMIYVEYPVGMLPHRLLIYILGIVKMNNSRLLVVSYWYPPSQVRSMFYDILTRSGIEKNKLGFIDKNIVYQGYNPSSLSLDELYSLELELVDNANPDIVLFLGVDTHYPYLDKKYIDYLRNELLYLRKRGIISFRLGSEISREFTGINASLADTYIRYVYREEDGRFKKKIIIIRKSREPLIIDEKISDECYISSLRAIRGEE